MIGLGLVVIVLFTIIYIVYSILTIVEYRHKIKDLEESIKIGIDSTTALLSSINKIKTSYVDLATAYKIELQSRVLLQNIIQEALKASASKEPEEPDNQNKIIN